MIIIMIKQIKRLLKRWLQCYIMYRHNEGMNEHNTFLFKNITLSSLLLEKIEIGCKREREKDRETKNSDTDQRRSAIFTHISLDTLILYSELHLAFLLLSWGPTAPTTSVARRCFCPDFDVAPTGWQWPSMTDRLT